MSTENDWQDESGWPEMTLEHLEELALDLNAECHNIETQLGGRNKMDEQGRRLTQAEYFDWRQKAKWALTKKRQIYSRLVQYLRVRRKSADEQQESKRYTKAVLIAQTVSADEIIGMSDREREDLVRKCDEAAELLVRADKKDR